MEEEGPGILNLAARGSREWVVGEINEPSEVKKVTADYRSEQNLVLQFIEDRCERGDNLRETAMTLFGSFTHWKEQNDIRTLWNKPQFGLELKRLEFKSKKNGEHYWLRLKLRFLARTGSNRDKS